MADAARTSRLTENKRRYRARQKEYVADLERRLADTRAQGISATIQVQLAARKVAAENECLRQLLWLAGFDDDEIDLWAQREGCGTKPDGTASGADSGCARRREIAQKAKVCAATSAAGCKRLAGQGRKSCASGKTKREIRAAGNTPVSTASPSSTHEPAAESASPASPGSGAEMATCPTPAPSEAPSAFGAAQAETCASPDGRPRIGPCKLLSLLAENPTAEEKDEDKRRRREEDEQKRKKDGRKKKCQRSRKEQPKEGSSEPQDKDRGKKKMKRTRLRNGSKSGDHSDYSNSYQSDDGRYGRLPTTRGRKHKPYSSDASDSDSDTSGTSDTSDSSYSGFSAGTSETSDNDASDSSYSSYSGFSSGTGETIDSDASGASDSDASAKTPRRSLSWYLDRAAAAMLVGGDSGWLLGLKTNLMTRACEFCLASRIRLSCCKQKSKKKNETPKVNAAMLEYALEPFTRLVYGSNMIESAGNSLDITRKLCAPVFQGQSFLVSADIDRAAVDYVEHVQHLQSANRPTGHSEVVRSRREIIQHAQALLYTILEVFKCSRFWSEDLILDTHRMLHAGLDDQVEPGAYRTHEVAVKYEKPGQERQKAHMCMRASAVSEYMKDMVEHLNQDTADPDSVRDPYVLAARYHHQFVNIHPFGDGNGRMSRIILNVLLLKHARPPCVSVFGLTEEERDTYIAIATRASQVFYAEDIEVSFDQHTGHLELAEFIRDKSVAVDGQ